jgi:hypothetical protein
MSANRHLPPKFLSLSPLLLVPLELRQVAFGFFGELCLYVMEEVLDPCLMLILGTGGAGASALVACAA